MSKYALGFESEEVQDLWVRRTGDAIRGAFERFAKFSDEMDRLRDVGGAVTRQTINGGLQDAARIADAESSSADQLVQERLGDGDARERAYSEAKRPVIPRQAGH